MGVSNTAEGIRDLGPYVFRSSIPEADVLPNTVRVSHEHLGYETAAILYSNNDDYSSSAADTFRAELESIGVHIVASETFSIGDTDFRAQLTKVAAARPDVLVVSTLYREAALLVRQARQLGLDQPVIGSNGFNSPEFITNAGPAADGALGAPGSSTEITQKCAASSKSIRLATACPPTSSQPKLTTGCSSSQRRSRSRKAGITGRPFSAPLVW